jgi:uncharacterized damage-inducible protein DinB
MIDAFRMLARYNRIANERLYDACEQLDPVEYRRERKGSFGSIHALLNHMLLGDQIWLLRFAGACQTTPPLNTILFDTVEQLRLTRAVQDKQIEVFFARIDGDFLKKKFSYINNQGKDYVENALVAVLHFFNHQTHHRGQVHVMISQTDVNPPSLDMHRILNP